MAIRAAEAAGGCGKKKRVLSSPPLNAHAATLYLARSTALPVAGDSIQMFPPGKQVVTPSRLDGKEPKPLELMIDEQTAADLEAVRAALQAKADAGEGDAPYLDFNHDDGEASAWVKRIFWGGDDALLGGVRVEVEWSAAGEAAVQGKTFRRFSPCFFASNGRVTGAPVNMGGLVNRAAFTTIQPLFAKEAECADEESTTTESTTTPTMTEEQIQALETENADLKAKLAEMQTQLDEATATAKAAAEKEAASVVAAAAKEGRIPPGEEIQKKWAAAIVADPSAKDLLLAMAPNPALTEQFQAKPAPTTTDTQHQAKAGLDAVAEEIKAKRSTAAE